MVVAPPARRALTFSPILNITPRNFVLSRLFFDLFDDSVTEDKYDADLAELSFHLSFSGGDSVGFIATGFSDKLAVLLKAMLERVVVFKVDEARFADLADRVCRDSQRVGAALTGSTAWL
jgi:insulysin